MRITWTKQTIPSEWQRPVAVYIPKQQDAKTIEQFRSIALLNVEEKIFFSITSIPAARKPEFQVSLAVYSMFL